MKWYRLLKVYSTTTHTYSAGYIVPIDEDRYVLGFERLTEGDMQRMTDWFELIPEEKKKESISSDCLRRIGEIEKGARKEETKPPIGIIPEWLWKEQRELELDGAIKRYRDAFKPIPEEWIDEKYDLQTWLLENKQTKDEKARSWEIASIKYGDLLHVFDGSPYDNFLKKTISFGKETAWAIYSVKRRSDGEVFTVGDFYYVPIDDSYRRLDHFHINQGGGMFLNYQKKEMFGLNITAAKKMKE